MKVYHYASIDSWMDIKKGSTQSGGVAGLGACMRICNTNFDDEGARDVAVFGLLEPEPINWVENTEFPLAWSALMCRVGRLLLAYEPTDEMVDKSFIIDWSHRERLLNGHKDDLGKNPDKKISSKARRIAEKAYWASRVPLASYIENPDILTQFELPEVITMCNIPFAILEIAEQQPRLQNISSFVNDDLQLAIERNPELEVLSAYVA